METNVNSEKENSSLFPTLYNFDRLYISGAMGGVYIYIVRQRKIGGLISKIAHEREKETIKNPKLKLGKDKQTRVNPNPKMNRRRKQLQNPKSKLKRTRKRRVNPKSELKRVGNPKSKIVITE